MKTSSPEGWSDSKYKSFRARGDSSSDSDTELDDDDSSIPKIKGYNGQKFKKILKVEDLIPE